MSRTPKSARKSATRPIPLTTVDPPTQPIRAPQEPSKTARHRAPNIEQPLDPPEFEGNVLADIRARWKAGGSLLPQPAESGKLLAKYKQTHGEVVKAREVLQKALEAERAAILDLARAFGGNSLRIDGTVHDFACRGDLVFFRLKGVGIIDT
jgi:hypothetical protein